MPEDPIRRAFDLLDRPVQPDPEFREALFDRLVEEAKHPRRFSPPRRLVTPRHLDEALGVRPPQPARSWRRRRRPALLVAAALVALAAMVAAVVLVPRPPSALAIVTEARARFADLPSLRALVVKVVPGAGLAEEVGQPVPDWTVVTEISFQDDRTWRREIVQDENDPFEPQGQVGSFQVSTLKEQLVYDAASRTATVEPTPERTAAQSRLEALREMSPSLDQAAPVSDEGIRSCEVLADEKIAGRDAHHLQCTFDDGGGGVASGAEAWLDVETGVLLRLTFPNGLRFEVTDIEYGVSFPPGIFSTEPPDTPADPATGLAIGEEVPTWVLPALGGGMIDLASLRGEPTLVYVWATWCPVCAEGEVSGAADPLAAFDDAWLQHGASVNLVAVAHLDEESAVSRLVEDRGYTVPIALDGSGEALAAWGVEGIPLLVVLDAEGALAGAYLGDLQGPDVRAIVEAVTAGGPLPSVGGKTVEQLPS